MRSGAAFLVLQQVLGVDLVFVEHDVDGGVVDVVDAAVVEVDVPSILGRGPAVVRGSRRVFSHQKPHQKHGLELGVTGVGVRVLGIQGEVTACVWTRGDISVSVTSYDGRNRHKNSRKSSCGEVSD